jgi:hypothetical protein
MAAADDSWEEMSGRERLESLRGGIAQLFTQSDFESMGASDVDRIEANVMRNLDAFVDPGVADNYSEALESNWERIKQETGLKTQTEVETAIQDFDIRAAQNLMRQVRETLRELMDEYGLLAVADTLGEQPTGLPADAQDDLEEVVDEFGVGIVDEVVEERVSQVLSAIDSDLRLVSDERLENTKRRLQQARSEARRQGRAAVLERLERAFGLRFEDVDEAIERLSDRSGRQPSIKIANIVGRMTATGPTVRIDSQDAAFAEWIDAARREARRQLELENLGDTNTKLGVIRLADGELMDIDYEEGRAALGAVEGEAPFEQRTPFDPEETEQEELPEPQTEPEEVAQDLINALEPPDNGI